MNSNRNNRNNNDDWWKWIVGWSLGPLAVSNFIVVLVMVGVGVVGLVLMIINETDWSDWITWATIVLGIPMIMALERWWAGGPRRTAEQKEQFEGQGCLIAAAGGILILLGATGHDTLSTLMLISGLALAWTYILRR